MRGEKWARLKLKFVLKFPDWPPSCRRPGLAQGEVCYPLNPGALMWQGQLSVRGLVGRDSILGRGKVLFRTPQRQDRLWRGPSILISNGYRGSFRPGGAADHSPITSAEVNNGVTVPQLLHTSSCHGASLIKQRRGTFTCLQVNPNLLLHTQLTT
jgi:hypothetical protein